jgi:hypothetical protein
MQSYFFSIQMNQEKKLFIFLTVTNDICYQTIIFSRGIY